MTHFSTVSVQVKEWAPLVGKTKKSKSEDKFYSDDEDEKEEEESESSGSEDSSSSSDEGLSLSDHVCFYPLDRDKICCFHYII